ncbi:hypothetical protein PQS31_14385 [Luteimonas sp BLCC-B24]|uniref:hypothetical protein n=1 Tax=Luteimonas sp. BLCC-B24 TaxID=3025317 RepID=UPI00234C4904|nr:hypothetical protein [Luteimonas sp. BLCC-B24]MDC7807999.1 hypothetical protein [Luteimonas sp. BLCC-B24]
MKDFIVSAELDYSNHGAEGSLHLVEGADGVNGTVSTAEMERVYKGTFVKSKATREYYGAIKSASENDICPLCSQRTISQLDHYLPQSANPAFTVTPLNLVPVCSECNKTKLALQAAVAGDQTFHPYFEDADDGRWLFAEVLETTPAALVFRTSPPDNWGAVKSQRISSHFRIFKLAELYASHAAVEISDIRFGLISMSRRNAPHKISAHLREVALSRAAAHANSWRRAAYEALADSQWFCAGGYR